MPRLNAQPADLYSVLGVSRTATSREIRAAYYALARIHHPDAGGDPRHWQEIAAAYNVLSDPARRAAYDAGRDPYERRPAHRAGVEQMGSAITAQLGLDTPPALPKGIDVLLMVPEPGQHTVAYSRYASCAACHATGVAPGTTWATCGRCKGRGEYRRRRWSWSAWGWLWGWVVCERCRGVGTQIPLPCPCCYGEGRVRREEQVSICIPAPPRRARLQGLGNAGIRGGAAGDLLAGVGDVLEASALTATVGLVGRATDHLWSEVATLCRAAAQVERWVAAYAREFRV